MNVLKNLLPYLFGLLVAIGGALGIKQSNRKAEKRGRTHTILKVNEKTAKEEIKAIKRQKKIEKKIDDELSKSPTNDRDSVVGRLRNKYGDKRNN